MARQELRTAFASAAAAHLTIAVQLVASELVSNVIQHTDNGGLLRAWHHAGHHTVRIEVADTDHHAPAPKRDASDLGGRGLQIVDAHADDWGVQHTPTGKIVWVTLHSE